MAIRYSGDAEIRIYPEGKDLYLVKIRVPGKRMTLEVKHRSLFSFGSTSRVYDGVAKKALRTALEIDALPIEFDGMGDVLIRRVFQAPCPID